MGTLRLTKKGITYKTNDSSVYLDPKTVHSDGINFVSHAHIDHLPTGGSGTIISSKETREIAKIRGFSFDSQESLDNFSLIDPGHILGSKGLRCDGVFYTGVLALRGLPEFIFPEISKIVDQVNGIISDLYSNGKPVLLLGYELGKSQTISQLFDSWEPVYYHDSVKKMNDLHRRLGVPIREEIGYTEAKSNGLLDKKPWIMIAPMMSSKNQFIQEMRLKYGAVTVGFSGWAMSKKFGFSRGTDYSIPLSDHCDYNELIQLVEQSGAEKVYTVHGFVDEFAQDLVHRGISAQPLRESSLDEFC